MSDFFPKSSYHSASKTYAPTWSQTGGHSAGHIIYDDLEHLSFFFTAPASFRGDLSQYIGGRLSWYAKTNVNNWPHDGFVVIAGANDYVYYSTGGLPEVDSWVEQTVPLTHQGWTMSQPTGPAADEATFAAVLSNVTALHLPGEAAEDLVEATAIDEVSLEGP